MSGPIVRKYGFPNFEKIFGERPLAHGKEDDAGAAEGREPSTSTPQRGETDGKRPADEPGKAGSK
ncbi:hypothetical protein OJF2_58220 [Aquisphaera giovannonii]|uniref:Uncharacterized protein n=1 Tax=Aquisphaera giovannonii TaxID=406548 RepID=A0A5B9WAW0_9BACT|nr:hypothetical protein OJF2_58220 [Aquisphaera giovannonii]